MRKEKVIGPTPVIWFVKCQLLAVGILLFSGTLEAASLIDANFRLKRHLRVESAPTNQLGTLYKGALGKSMYSHCRWLPSDSQYLEISTIQCGAFRGTISAISRFMREYDAHRLTDQVVNDHGLIRFVDFSKDCDVF